MKTYPKGMPCWAPGAADALSVLLTGKEIAWEWGGGASSVWLHNQVSTLYVMESNAEWKRRVVEQVDPKRCTVYLAPTNSIEYLHYHKSLKVKPTLWLIDGYQRIECLKLVKRESEPGDIVVLDDALDYAESLGAAKHGHNIQRFRMPHPYAGTPLDVKRHAKDGNTERTHHAMTKETWIWQV